MQVVYQQCAAVDVGKDVIAVAVRLPGDGPDGRSTIKRMFKTFYGVLAEAARWLTELGVTHVAMEATGVIRGADVRKLDMAQVVPSRTRPPGKDKSGNDER
jgi:hypothetical protein